MRFISLMVLTCAALFSLAQPVAPSDLHLLDLRVWLKSNWYDSYFSDLGYSGARMQMYGYVDEENGMIECVYTGFQQAAGFVTFPDPINTEHVIPQSFFGSVSPMRSDIYNLRPTHGSANSERSNFPFGEVDDAAATWYGIDGGGNYFSTGTPPANPEVFSERVGSFWEPREEYKGDLARQVFYFFTMYPTQGGDISSMGDINTLYDWHLNDPVSAEELQRVNRTEIAQGNRNPYVDYPDLVYEAWFWVAIPGCTDPAATNYDSNATTDDGSCEYILEVLGCTDPTASNYDPNATSDDGSCTYINEVLGCTYAEAINFNPTATVDDGSCLFDNGIPGCTYPEAINFVSNATIDDGSCVFDIGVQGCTYLDAVNFDATATVDDGSCIFNLTPSCVGDTNIDGVVDVNDMLNVLSAFGSFCQ